ncbi:unnamed protein product, partial [Hapterophycus canaliculatus]
GFVGGFRDIAVGTSASASSSSSSSSAGGTSTTDALIQALSEPLKPSRYPGEAGGLDDRVGSGGRRTRTDSGSSSSSSSSSSSGSRRGSSGKAGPGAPRHHHHHQQRDGRPPRGIALDDRSKELDPPSRNVTITFDPDASTLLGCITASTDAYGPALCADTAANLSREETAAYLERWVLIAVKHGVLPRELRALLQDGDKGRHPDGSVGAGEAREDRGPPSPAAYRPGAGGSGGGSGGGEVLFRSGSASSSDRGGGGGGKAAASASWIKYGWNRFDPPSQAAAAAAAAAGTEGGPGSGGMGGQRRRLPFNDEEAAEEERMENLAE